MKALLPLLAYQDSNFDVEIIFWSTSKRLVRSTYIAIEIDTLLVKTKKVELKKYKFEYRGASRLQALSGNSGRSSSHRGVQNQRFPNQKF